MRREMIEEAAEKARQIAREENADGSCARKANDPELMFAGVFDRRCVI